MILTRNANVVIPRNCALEAFSLKVDRKIIALLLRAELTRESMFPLSPLRVSKEICYICQLGFCSLNWSLKNLAFRSKKWTKNGTLMYKVVPLLLNIWSNACVQGRRGLFIAIIISQASHFWAFERKSKADCKWSDIKDYWNFNTVFRGNGSFPLRSLRSLETFLPFLGWSATIKKELDSWQSGSRWKSRSRFFFNRSASVRNV